MSLSRPFLNHWLRTFEKPLLRHASDPVRLRARFELTSRLFFHAPLGTHARTVAVAGRDALHITVGDTTPCSTLLYFHGGGYAFGSPRTHSALVARICKVASAEAILPDYRKAPEHPFPAAVDDAMAAYRETVSNTAAPLILGGDSAGGGLALALLARLIAEGDPLPAGVFAFSPLTDLTFSGTSIKANAAHDVLLPADRLSDIADGYVGSADREHPFASPLFATFDGAPPVWLTASDTEILLDDSKRLAERLAEADVEVSFKIAHDLPHVWPMFHNTLPEATETIQALADWINQRCRTSDDS